MKDLVPNIITRAAEHLRYVWFLAETAWPQAPHLYPGQQIKISGGGGGFTLGLLKMILGLIYLKGSSARKAQVWEMLCRLEMNPLKYRFLFGHRKRLIIDDFVQQ